MRIKMYPAENGDAFLISSDKTNILIDAGYARTFNSYIRQDLEEIASRGACLNLAIVTHIDADHIGGIIRFLLLNSHSETNNIVPVEGIWHNSLRSLTSDYRSRAITSGIVDIAKGFGIHVVAEGIETLEQLCILEELDCEQAQGFYLSRPVPATALNKSLSIM